MKKFYITTAIDYTNSKPHLGHAYEKIFADVLARWHRLRGEDVYYLTGTDEHGQKVEKAAKSAGKEPQKFVDELVKDFKKMLEKLNISNSDFIRTTDDRHIKVCLEVFKKVFEKGDIYKGIYEGLYCEGCEAFYLEKDIVDGLCPVHKKPLELLKEESYFFRMSKYEKQLIDFIKKNKDFILPRFRQAEVLNRLKEGLRDLSISRTSFRWGIPIPNDKKHIIYVWFDALLNYISALGYPDDEKYKKYWPADCHVIGKDIYWFHTVIWPTILMSAEIELPKTVFIHGYINISGQKMSKTAGITVDPIKLAEKYGADALRYFLIKEIVSGQDGDFSEEAIIEKINSELADDLGNLLMRVVVLIEKNFEGKIPKQGKLEAVDEKLIEKSMIAKEIDRLMLNYEPNRAIERIWEFVKNCNKYLNETEPWKIKDKERLATILYNLVESLRIIGILLLPFIPETAAKVLEQIGQKEGKLKDAEFSSKTTGQVKKAEILFHKIEKKKDLVQKFDFRVAKVLSVENHPRADKLYVLQIDAGTEKRQLVAGLRNYLKPDEITGKKIIFIANLKPANLRGVESQGMLLAAEKDGKIKLLEAEKSQPGEKVYVIEPNPEKEVTIDDFAKIKFEVKERKVFYKGLTLKTEKEDIFVDIDDGAEVK